MKRHMWWTLAHSLSSWPRLEDMLEYEGNMTSAAYWSQLTALLESCQAGAHGTDADAAAAGGAYNSSIHESLRKQLPPDRPLLPHKDRGDFRVNEYKREMRAEQRLRNNQVDYEDFEGMDLFGDDD